MILKAKKINVEGILFLVSFFSILFFGVVMFASAQVPDGCSIDSPGIQRNCTEYYWNPVYPLLGAVTCKNNNNTLGDFVRTSSNTTLSECIRNGNCPATGYGNACAEPCLDPSACGDCECRCVGAQLYCADRYFVSSDYTVDTCKVAVDSTRCMPTASITLPVNGNSYTKGSTITFRGVGTDPLASQGETIIQHQWVIRTVANNAAANFASDLVVNKTPPADYTNNTLPPDDYVAFFRVKNGPGVWSTYLGSGSYVWKYVYFSVKENGVCNTARAKTYTTTATAWAGTSWCTGGTAANTPTSFLTPGQTKTWNCNGIGTGATSVTCTASMQAAVVNGTCGINAGTYTAADTSWRSLSGWCATGNPANIPASFLAPSTTVQWDCLGTGGGTNANPRCSATRSAALDVTASVNPPTVDIGGQVRWCANVTGGVSPYTYAWSGAVTGSTQCVDKIYGTVGTFTGSVTVKDNSGAQDIDDADLVVEDNRVPQ